ncbi:hypothetical protein HDV57DRAFT_234891 [Trichoderma longibrachiatum]|uniref:Uncharacterized protein n=1 Tax=Trichoderma longibrachiatum ATCC 18648 TaxID=983965 RepID=A0A2T4CEB1_TRILO|nr:hypothetical protein M440DRAFT_1105242 [Trichoderma longibrachiatum ATCC 18648]
MGKQYSALESLIIRFTSSIELNNGSCIRRPVLIQRGVGSSWTGPPNFSRCCLDRSSGGNQLLEGAISLSPPCPYPTIDLHVEFVRDTIRFRKMTMREIGNSINSLEPPGDDRVTSDPRTSDTFKGVGCLGEGYAWEKGHPILSS